MNQSQSPIKREYAPTDRQRELTNKTIRRIAELRIKALKLTCTVDEYIARTQEQTEKAVAK